MILIEMFPCTNHLENLQRERYWCENLNATLNSVVPSRTKQEYTLDHKDQSKLYREDHKDQKMEYNKQYNEQHKEPIKKQNKQYYKEHKEHIRTHQKTVIYCQCGCSYTRQNKTQHERSNKHKEYEKNRLYYDIRRGLNIIKKLDAFFKNKL
jgi:hypothetical protein